MQPVSQNPGCNVNAPAMDSRATSMAAEVDRDPTYVRLARVPTLHCTSWELNVVDQTIYDLCSRVINFCKKHGLRNFVPGSRWRHSSGSYISKTLLIHVARSTHTPRTFAQMEFLKCVCISKNFAGDVCYFAPTGICRSTRQQPNMAVG